MRVLVLGLVLVLSSEAQTPSPPKPVATSTQAALTQAIVGHWTGVLEYRDYSEPATSTKRVQLPTWLAIQPAPEGLYLDYVYDDGPAKTVRSHSALLIDEPGKTYKLMSTDNIAESYTITGLDSLQDGRGTLILNGQGTDNKKPAEIRTTWAIRRNLLSWLEEVRPANSTEPFVFRHRYTFTRAEQPK